MFDPVIVVLPSKIPLALVVPLISVSFKKLCLIVELSKFDVAPEPIVVLHIIADELIISSTFIDPDTPTMVISSFNLSSSSKSVPTPKIKLFEKDDRLALAPDVAPSAFALVTKKPFVECKINVLGFKGAVYKKFISKNDALNFINNECSNIVVSEIVDDDEKYIPYAAGTTFHQSLQNQLKELDELSYHDIAIDNPQRLIRALEICIGTNQPYSSFKTNSKKERDFETIKIGLIADREILYDRINRRVDIMIQNGLLEEAKALLPHKNLNALQTVGYRELFAYFEGNTDKDFAVSEIKKNTRRFAKRQLTWFRKDEDINWFDFETPFDEISALIDSKINAF